jgi:hypothetical protein
MSDQVTLAVSMAIDGDTQCTYTIDELNADATFILVGAQGYESYIQLDTQALQRFHDMTGEALTELRVHQSGCRP